MPDQGNGADSFWGKPGHETPPALFSPSSVGVGRV
jgi:hypothetical protein